MLGHELTHIRNGDVQLMVVAVIIAGVVGFFGELFFRMFTNCAGVPAAAVRLRRPPRHRRTATARAAAARSSSIIIAVALIVLAWLLSQVVKLALSRSREFLADAGSVELTKNPDAMISALRKIENRGELPGATSAVMELCVDNPREGFADLFATHPSVETRVKALVQYAGGHDPGPLALPSDDGGRAGQPRRRRRPDCRHRSRAGPGATLPARRRGPVGAGLPAPSEGPGAGTADSPGARPSGPRNSARIAGDAPLRN